MNDYEEKLEARRERYLDRAEKATDEANSRFKQADHMAEQMNGQPILVGHHSEKSHRGAIKRMHGHMDKGVEAHQKSKHYVQKAASVGKAGISSDDPEAVQKLKRKIEGAEASQEHMKAVNAAWRKAGKPKCSRNGIDGDAWKAAIVKDPENKHLLGVALEAMRTDFMDRAPFTYALSNNSANIKRMKDRLTSLEAREGAETTEREVNGVRVVENVEENRIQLFFDGKPPAETRQVLKSRGFRWSRYNMAWQRHLNGAGRYAAQCVLDEIGQDAEQRAVAEAVAVGLGEENH